MQFYVISFTHPYKQSGWWKFLFSENGERFREKQDKKNPEIKTVLPHNLNEKFSEAFFPILQQPLVNGFYKSKYVENQFHASAKVRCVLP